MKFRLAEVDPLVEQAYTKNLRSIPMSELRGRRDECERAEVALSYIRRMIHGRLDLVYFDLTRRSEGRGATELGDIVGNLSSILSSRIHHAPDSGRLAGFLAPDLDEVCLEDLDSIAGADRIHMLPELSDEEVRSMSERLTELENEVSERRGKVHDVIDKLHKEIVRRYRTGEASVDELLK